ncbi:hypothetical protein NL676_020053 [Syzygium grande]|nr:hypothetical protein NL676_020053 [Syzygium grande]
MIMQFYYVLVTNMTHITIYQPELSITIFGLKRGNPQLFLPVIVNRSKVAIAQPESYAICRLKQNNHTSTVKQTARKEAHDKTEAISTAKSKSSKKGLGLRSSQLLFGQEGRWEHQPPLPIHFENKTRAQDFKRRQIIQGLGSLTWTYAGRKFGGTRGDLGVGWTSWVAVTEVQSVGRGGEVGCDEQQRRRDAMSWVAAAAATSNKATMPMSDNDEQPWR